MLAYHRGRLAVEGVGARDLAERFGTPLYVYSKRSLLESLRAFRDAFRRRPALVCYALKANSNASVCRLFALEGAGADIVSGGELLRALGAGFEPRRIVFSGVGKTEGDLALALRRGILTLNVESGEELAALSRVARRMGRRAPVSVRLNPDVAAKTHPYVATGRAEDKFGVEEREALELYRRAARDPWLEVKGIQCHIGSQITAAEPYRRAARSVARVMERLEKRGVRLELADFGGGMGISYREERPLNLSALAEALAAALKPWPGVRLLLEPGRCLTAEAGILLTRVLYRKKSSRRSFVIVDAAMNDLVRPALYNAYHPVWPEEKRGGKKELVDVVGPVCESADFLARQRALPASRPGDILAVLKAGAYGFSMSSQYNSRPRAAEVLVDGGKARLIRRREVFEDLVRAET